MLKKIILGGLLIILSGILIVGAVNRTTARSGETSSTQHEQTTQVVEQRGGRNGAGGNVEAVGEASVMEWQTVSGTVSSVDASHAEIRLSDGRSVEVGGRAWQLAAAQNFTANAGDSVTVHGFDENGVFQAGQIDNQSNGQSLSLRDATGRPLWAGRGRS
jgi:uncharacterized protein (DUF2345 family)